MSLSEPRRLLCPILERARRRPFLSIKVSQSLDASSSLTAASVAPSVPPSSFVLLFCPSIRLPFDSVACLSPMFIFHATRGTVRHSQWRLGEISAVSIKLDPLYWARKINASSGKAGTLNTRQAKSVAASSTAVPGDGNKHDPERENWPCRVMLPILPIQSISGSRLLPSPGRSISLHFL